ncbi:MAG: hypothetical protein M3T49_10405, partial [Candidatus Eremiobacteraeota bacterium]|nr:hypothetical protein [Candidatus Eremiobacteraeota bacterium]
MKPACKAGYTFKYMRPGITIVMRHVKAPRLVDHSDRRISRRDAVRVGDAVEPFWHASAQRLQLTVAVDRASINRALRRKRAGGCCYKDVVAT